MSVHVRVSDYLAGLVAGLLICVGGGDKNKKIKKKYREKI